jgi:hypothetical protein
MRPSALNLRRSLRRPFSLARIVAGQNHPAPRLAGREASAARSRPRAEVAAGSDSWIAESVRASDAALPARESV